MTLNAAESNRVAVYFIPEVTWGVTPTSGEVRLARITSSSIVASKETETSQEIRADRMVPSVIEVSAATSGDIEGEMSAGTYDTFFQQFLLGAWTKAMKHWRIKGTSVTITGVSEITIAGVDWTDYFTSGQIIKLEGFVEPENNGYFTLSTGTPPAFGTDTVLTVDETSLVTVATGLSSHVVMDAADVIDVSSAIVFGSSNDVSVVTSTADMVVGQKVYMEGMDKETGTITTVITTDPVDGEIITVSDGTSTIVYELHSVEASVTAGNIYVNNNADEATLAGLIEAAINAQFAAGNSKVSATVAGLVVTLQNNATSGGSITTDVLSTAVAVVDFTGGVAGNAGFFTVASIDSATAFTVEETLTAASAGPTVVIKGSHLRNPGTVADITKQSMSMLTSFTDVTKKLIHDGLRVSTFSLTVEAGSLLSATFGFMGSETATTTTNSAKDLSGTGFTVLDTTPTEVMNATDNVGTVLHNGAALSTSVMSIELSGDNALREQKAVGNKFAAGIGYGRFSMEGALTAYFQDFTLYDAFINHTTASIEFPITDADNYHMIFRIPSVKFTSDPIAPGGIDEDIMEEIEFTAQRDATLNTMMMIDRFSSILPFAAA